MSQSVEEEELTLKLEATSQDSQCEKFMLVGKILASRVLNKIGVMNILSSVWNPSQPFKQVRIFQNLYSFEFSNEEDMLKILEASPWSVMNYSMILQKWDGNCAVDDLRFDKIAMWVRASGLPRCMFNVENGWKIASKLGNPVKVNIKESLYTYLRFRVEIPVDKPLRTGFWLDRGEYPRKWISLSSEKLAIFCYGCGIIGHEMEECKSVAT